MKALHKLYTSFLVLLAAATDRGMAKMLQDLKEENRTLRGKLPKRIELTPRGPWRSADRRADFLSTAKSRRLSSRTSTIPVF